MEKKAFEAIHRLSEAIAKMAHLQEIYDIILDTIADIWSVERASIMRLDPHKKVLKIVAQRGIPEEIWKKTEVPIGEGMSGRAFLEGKPLLIEEIQKNPRYKSHSFMIAPVHAALPMKMGQTSMGVINLTDRKTKKPFTEMDLKILTTLTDQVAAYMHLRDLIGELENAQKAKLELDVAREIQQRLLPKTPPILKNCSVAAYLCPAEKVGADYYDFFDFNKEELGLCIADVSGHNVGGALLAATLRSTLRAITKVQLKPDQVVQSVNETLFEDFMQSEQFASLVYAHLNHQNKILKLTNAGHNPPLLLSKQKEPAWLYTEDTLIGIEKKQLYHTKQYSLNSGDVVFFYTDGLTESSNPKGERFGGERCISFLQKMMHEDASQILKNILEAWRSFVSGALVKDDVTLLILKIN